MSLYTLLMDIWQINLGMILLLYSLFCVYDGEFMYFEYGVCSEFNKYECHISKKWRYYNENQKNFSMITMLAVLLSLSTTTFAVYGYEENVAPP